MRRGERNECRIDVKGLNNPQLLAYYAREQAASVENDAACDLAVDRIANDARTPLFSAHLTVSCHGHRTAIDEVNKDAFLAVRDAFDLARLWLAERMADECRSAS